MAGEKDHHSLYLGSAKRSSDDLEGLSMYNVGSQAAIIGLQVGDGMPPEDLNLHSY